MAMQPPPWMVLFRTRVLDVEGRCGSALNLLTEVQPRLALPMRTGTAYAATERARIGLAQEKLGEANHDLNIAACLMMSAEHLALHGGSPNPAEPLRSVQHLSAQNPAVLHALTKLDIAWKHAAEAYEAVEWCRGHLSTACLLLDHPGLPNVNGFIDTERGIAAAALRTAMQMVQVSAAQAGGARQDVTGRN